MKIMTMRNSAITVTLLATALCVLSSSSSAFLKDSSPELKQLVQQLQTEDLSELKSLEFGFAAKLLAKQLDAVHEISVESLSAQLHYLNHSPTQYHLGTEVPKSVFNTLPDNLDLLPVAQKKDVFFRTLLPSIMHANAKIQLEAQKLAYLQKEALCVQQTLAQYLQNPDTTSNQRVFLEKLMLKYRSKTFTDLANKVQKIPVPLVMAQAAIESGWGSSRAAKLAKNLFGMQNQTKNGLKPLGVPVSSKRRLYIYANISNSIEHYMLNLNRHSAYARFRKNRAANVSLAQQINTLDKYAEIGKKYPMMLLQLIHVNSLEDYQRFVAANSDQTLQLPKKTPSCTT